MNLADSIAQARKSGYSDAEITAYLSKDATLSRQVTQARKVGYSDGEIVSHLANPSLVDKAQDAGRQLAHGFAQGVAGFGDAVMQASPIGLVNNALQTAGNVASLFSGKTPASQPAAPVNVFSQLTARQTPQARSTVGEYAHTLGQNIPNAVAPGSAAGRIVNVVAPALMSETAGQVARKVGAGPRVEAAARMAGSVAGAAAASVRPQNVFAPAGSPAGQLAARARQDPAAMQQRANEFRDAGVDPTLTDVVDDAGRGVIRAAANRGTPARQQANQFATGRALNLPDRIGTQARRVISADPRTPDQIAQNLGDARGQAANTAFGAVRGDVVEMAPETVQALRNPLGRDAIAEAARRERDPAVRAALNRLANDALDAPSTPITVGMADRISRTLYGQGQAATRGGDHDLAATFNQLGDAVRNPARTASPGYQSALQGYADQSRLIEAAGRGEDFLKRNTDEFVANTPANGQAGNDLARATARRAIERAAGENPAAAPGVAKRIAEASEQQARNAHLLGPQDAERLQQGMRMEARAVDNANMVAPRAGSSTHLNDVDAAKIAGLAQVGQRALRHDWVGLGMDWLRSRGLSDRDAEALIQMATDPRQTDRAIGLIAQRAGNAQPFIAWRNAGLIGAAALTSAGAPASAQQPQQP